MGYKDPSAVNVAPSGVKIDPNDPAFNNVQQQGHIDRPDAPIIYLFSNSKDGDGIAYAMAEDGTVLGSHLCSHRGYMKHDLHDRDDRRAACEAHYPDGYTLVISGPGETIPPEVYERNQELGRKRDAEKAEDER